LKISVTADKYTLEIIKGRKIKRKELMTRKNKINKAILILKSIGLLDEIGQS
jgi:hypothetical protein